MNLKNAPGATLIGNYWGRSYLFDDLWPYHPVENGMAAVAPMTGDWFGFKFSQPVAFSFVDAVFYQYNDSFDANSFVLEYSLNSSEDGPWILIGSNPHTGHLRSWTSFQGNEDTGYGTIWQFPTVVARAVRFRAINGVERYTNVGNLHMYEFKFGGNWETVLGCMNPAAYNFNPNATEDDGSCQFCTIFGGFGAIPNVLLPGVWTLGFNAIIHDATAPVSVTWDIYLGPTLEGEIFDTVNATDADPFATRPGMLYNQWYGFRMTLVDANGCTFHDTKYLRVFANGSTDTDPFDDEDDEDDEGDSESDIACGCANVTSTISGGGPSPLRHCPPELLVKYQSNEFATIGLLAVKPRYGEWEAYTSYDIPIQGIEYSDAKGNVTPALLYKPCAVEMTTIPTALKLGSQAADVKALAIGAAAEQENTGLLMLGGLYLDRVKLLRGHYTEAYWEYREVDPDDPSITMAWTCGEIGNIGLDDLQATIELTTYDEMANRKVGSVLHVLCQVGAERNENFGTKRCFNETLQDGPLRANWTVECEVLPGSTKSVVVLSHGPNAITGAPLHALFDSHLENGDLEFLDAPDGGTNALVSLPIQAASVLTDNNGFKTVRAYPKISLAYDPAAGDKVNLVVGCRRTKQDCIFFDNLPNMRAQDLPGNADLLRRTRG